MKFQRATYVRSEADLAAEFYFRARMAGLEVFLEVPLPSIIHRSGEMRADAVVVGPGDEVICCVEFKAEGRDLILGTRQRNAYKGLEYHHGVPTYWINTVAIMDSVIFDIQQLQQGLPPRRRRAAG